MAKALEETHKGTNKSICSADYYSKVLGVQCDSESVEICHHSLCKNIFSQNAHKRKARKVLSHKGLGKLYECQAQVSQPKETKVPTLSVQERDNYFSQRWNPGNAKL